MTITSQLPLVRGRHRNRALASLRRERAVQLRASGMTFQAIADEMGYSSKATAYNVVKKAMTEHVVDSVQEFRYYELARLMRLQRAIWDKAMAGDLRAIAEARAIIQLRIKLLGLVDAAEAPKPRTVVVSDARDRAAAAESSFLAGAG